MREISLDTETTGLEALGGDRIVEIGCVELWNRMPTGKTFHVYLDPERPMSAKASEITGLTDSFLRGKPKFASIADAFRAFIAEDPLVIHNAAFDIGFLDAEFARVGAPPVTLDRVVDTLALAKKRFPGAQASLDALCRRFGIDNSAREKHGALLDAELLAEVYLELRGGRQPGLALDASRPGADGQSGGEATSRETARVDARPPRRSRLTKAEAEAHAAFVDTLGEDAIWRRVS